MSGRIVCCSARSVPIDAATMNTMAAMTARMLLRMAMQVSGRLGFGGSGRVGGEAVDLAADMGGFGGGVGQGNGPVEGLPGFRVAAELQQERAPHAEEVEIAAERIGQGLDHRQGLGRALR